MYSQTYTNYQAKWTPQEIAYLEKYWAEKSDAELAEILNKKNSAVVKRERYKRGLKLPRRGRRSRVSNWKRPSTGVKKHIDASWLKYALIEGGLTLSDVGGLYGVTGERIRRIAIDFHININERSVLWYAHRYNLPEFAHKGWLEKQLKKFGGASRLSRYFQQSGIHISAHKIRSQARMLGIDKALLSYQIPLVVLKCCSCGKRFQRKKRLIGKNQQHFFCSHRCRNSWLKENGIGKYRKTDSR